MKEQLAQAWTTAALWGLEYDALKQELEEEQQAGVVRASEAARLQVGSILHAASFSLMCSCSIADAQAAFICFPATVSRPGADTLSDVAAVPVWVLETVINLANVGHLDADC